MCLLSYFIWKRSVHLEQNHTFWVLLKSSIGIRVVFFFRILRPFLFFQCNLNFIGCFTCFGKYQVFFGKKLEYYFHEVWIFFQHFFSKNFFVDGCLAGWSGFFFFWFFISTLLIIGDFMLIRFFPTFWLFGIFLLMTVMPQETGESKKSSFCRFVHCS